MKNNKTYDHLIIGSGIGGLTLAAMLAKGGESVLVVEKNPNLGGRANFFKADGYFFDMGPSWFMQLDVWEQTFKVLGEDLYKLIDLVKLEPGYRVFDAGSERVFFDVPSGDLESVIDLFEDLEPGSGPKLREYIDKSRAKYELGYDLFLYRNYNGLGDFFNLDLVKRGKGLGNILHLLQDMHTYIKKNFKSPEVVKIMEYVLIFIGSDPKATPSLYSLMNYLDFEGGVYYPQGGWYKVIEALVEIGRKHGVKYITDCEVDRIIIDDEAKIATGVITKDSIEFNAGTITSNADIAWTDQKLLPKEYQQYSDSYWKKRVYAPSAFLLYLGVDGEIPELIHHNFRFASDWEAGFGEVFDVKVWPKDPSFYVCVTSKTDPTVAPKGKENLYILVPIASGLEATDQFLEDFKNRIYTLIEEEMKVKDFSKRIEYERLFTLKDFKEMYHAPQGTGLGLAHTLGQSTVFRPNNIHKKITNLYFCGAGTNPGIGTSIAAISAQNAYKRIRNITHPKPLEPSEVS